MGGGGTPNSYLGPWGAFGSQKQRGIIQYSLAANRQRATAGILKGMAFNGFRRFKQQAGYIIPPFVIGYLLIDWAERRNHFLNSKEGRALYASEEE